MQQKSRLVAGLWGLAVLLLVLVLVAAAKGTDKPSKPHRCTHGVSSTGPVEIVNGKVVGGSATAHTEACLR